jgi:hypothetical protein
MPIGSSSVRRVQRKKNGGCWRLLFVGSCWRNVYDCGTSTLYLIFTFRSSSCPGGFLSFSAVPSSRPVQVPPRRPSPPIQASTADGPSVPAGPTRLPLPRTLRIQGRCCAPRMKAGDGRSEPEGLRSPWMDARSSRLPFGRWTSRTPAGFGILYDLPAARLASLTQASEHLALDDGQPVGIRRVRLPAR